MASNYFIRINQFEGPLDLLVHLIKVHEYNILEIDIFALASQYLDYLRVMQFQDLHDAAAFIEMAASLIEIKSQQLLPQSAQQEALDEDLDEEDPSIALQKRLVAFETFRRAAEYLASVPLNSAFVCQNSEWTRLEQTYSETEGPLRGDPASLLILYEQMLSTLSERRPVKVKAVTDSLSLEEVSSKIKELIDKLQFLMFQQLYPKLNSRYEFVAHVLAMLQLVRDRELKIYQEELTGPIWMYQHELGAEAQEPEFWENKKREDKRQEDKQPENKKKDNSELWTASSTMN